jgi:hypothetical protein
MGADPWWIWLLPVLFAAPWIAAIVWVRLRSGRGSLTEPPSMAEAAARRLWSA